MLSYSIEISLQRRRMPKLSEKEIEEKLKSMKGWDVQEGKLRKIFPFKDFKEAVAFENSMTPEHSTQIMWSWWGLANLCS